jgi:copper chaperone CopZ
MQKRIILQKRCIMKIFILAVLFCFVGVLHTKAQNQLLNDTTVTVKVKGLTCANDQKTIADSIVNIKGVQTCVNGKLRATTSFKITYNTSVVKLDNIVAVIENTPGCGDGAEKPYKVKLN